MTEVKTEWKNQIDPQRINLKALYPDGNMPDDINQVLKGLYLLGREDGKRQAKCFREDLKDFLKDFKKEIKELEYFVSGLDSTAIELKYFVNDCIKRIDEEAEVAK